MAVISIIGTSGVGKSMLVKQLASLNCAPAFFEGEDGVWPQEILENIFSQGDPMVRWEYFMSRYTTSLERARTISNTGIDVYVDGAIMSAQAILMHEKESDKPKLQELIQKAEHCTSDNIVLLTASKEKIAERMSTRGRKTEMNNQALTRALSIQEHMITLAEKEHNVIHIDRSNLDFTNEKDLRDVHTRILNLKNKLPNIDL